MRVLSAILTILVASACTPESSDPVQTEVASPQQNVDWSVYLGDSGRQHYSPLTQINRDNVGALEVAWVYESEPEISTGTMYTSPIVVDGILYALTPSLVPFALNAATGEEIWRNDLALNRAAQRGLMWWERGDERRVFFAAGKELIAIDADDGQLVEQFGTGGKVDMTPAGRGGYIGVTVPGLVFEDKLIMGFSTTEGSDAYPGSIRAFSAVDGSLVWKFNTVPEPGDVGSQTWAEGSLERAGGANAWSGMTLDEERGMLFAPTGSTTPDFYGGDRLGDNLFGNSIVALDARTGTYRWHYQVVKHDLWDKDNPSPPTLVQIERDGKVIDAVTLTTKTGHLYAFDRDTGESLYPIVEIETPIPSTLPGEVPAAKQYVSSVEISRQVFEPTNRTPEARAYIEDLIDGFDLRPWAPPKIGTVLFYPWYDGGAEWGGSAFDPATNRLIVNSNDEAAVLTLAEVPAGYSSYGTYATHCGACHGTEREGTDRGPALDNIRERLGMEAIGKIMSEGGNGMPTFAHLSTLDRNSIYRYILPVDVPEKGSPSEDIAYALTSGYVYLRDNEGLPGNAPPWGTLNSIDLATGEIVWKVNFGNFLSHPDLDLGAISYGGPVVTASGLIFIGATPDKKFRAYNSDNGEIVWETELKAGAFSTPAIYSVDGRQYVVIAAGGGRLGPPSGSEYVAFALPEARNN
ncbi:MAG: PQQ-binding-like beta-propeller repeat protein [Gammaproteobacteria bacterium]|nr:PQQ-binding-like beta-propeller repeat protein [Gammaproteobacteria bacterium]